MNKKIWILTDGSDGMVSQVLGLAKNFSDQITEIETEIIFPWSKLQPGILPIFFWIFKNKLENTSSPDMIISCGRKSVYLSIFLKKKFKDVVNIHIQDPKINFKNFDYIVAPRHDNINGKNVIESIGALHKYNKSAFDEIISEDFLISKKNLISVIIGGNNKHYNFSLKEINNLISKVKELKKNNPKYNLLILYSRRTTFEMKELIKDKLKNISYIPKNDDKNPYTFALKYSENFIVTSDSTSMISECAFTGKPIYVYHLPFKRKSKRIEKFHNQFDKLNITKKLDKEKNLLKWTYISLDESKRIASIIKERIIKENT